jgi:hypothetical protein
MEPFVVTSLLYCKQAWQLLDAFADSARGLMRLYDGQSVTILGVLGDAAESRVLGRRDKVGRKS